MVANKKLLLKHIFQGFHRDGDRGLCDMELSGGFGNALRFDNGHKVFELFQGEMGHAIPYFLLAKR
jgi:hypothetical protein